MGTDSPRFSGGLVRQLVATEVADGCRHVSIHLAEQDDQILVLAMFTSKMHLASEGDVLSGLCELGAV
ncbi:hypothetical protein [Streptomyces sp. NPDC059215]|uniref:hypothetical protein n=1 Tax=Streptomyces sp. NPDC059215 TaxID=3346772 RepID=UPI00367A747A